MTEIGGFGDHVAKIDLSGGTVVSEGELCELEEMKAESCEHRGWIDGVVPDVKLDELDIDVGPRTGVSLGEAGAPADIRGPSRWRSLDSLAVLSERRDDESPDAASEETTRGRL